MELFVERLPHLTGASGAAVELAEGDKMIYTAASGSAVKHLGLRLKLRGSFSGLCVLSNRVLLCDDSESDPRVDRDATRKVGVRSMVVAPLQYTGRVVEALKILSPHRLA